MRKRERENPCGICGHYHKFEEGEVCATCGHRVPAASEKTTPAAAGVQVSSFTSVILPEFLYLGSYDNASRSGLLKTQGISRVLNTVFGCQNLYKNSFTYHHLKNDDLLQFEDANQFLETCERDKARVLVHCMSGKNRSPAIVIGYLMKSRGWRLPQAYQWVKERRPSVELTEAVSQQLQEYEGKIFGSIDTNQTLVFPPIAAPSFGFGETKANEGVPVPAFNNVGAPSIFAQPTLDISPQAFTFGAGQMQSNISGSPFNINPPPNAGDISMDST